MRHAIYASIGVLLLILLAALRLPVDQQGVIRHDTNLEHYRTLGRQPAFSCVGRYARSRRDTNYAAGVLIAPGWVLTAAHFVEDSSVWVIGKNTYFTKRIVKHPNLKSGATETQWTGYDLALVELEHPVREVVAVNRYYGRDEVGRIITKIGYGYLGNGLQGLMQPRHQERLGGQNVIDAAGGMIDGRPLSANVLIFDFDSPDSTGVNRLGSKTPLALEIGGSKGDSGGGVFTQIDGKWVLIGVVSGALNRDIKYGSIAAVVRVSSANEWIDSVIGNP